MRPRERRISAPARQPSGPARSGALRPARLRRPPHPACRDPAPGRPGASVVGMYGAALPTYPDRSRIARPVGRRHRAHSGRAGLDARGTRAAARYAETWSTGPTRGYRATADRRGIAFRRRRVYTYEYITPISLSRDHCIPSPLQSGSCIPGLERAGNAVRDETAGFTRTARAESLQQVGWGGGGTRGTTHHSRTFQTFLILFATLGTAPGAE